MKILEDLFLKKKKKPTQILKWMPIYSLTAFENAWLQTKNVRK